MSYSIAEKFVSHQKLISKIQDDKHLQKEINKAIRLLAKALKKKGRALFCGNGGSAADAEHLAAELSGRYLKERTALPAEALHVNGAALTAISNDYGYKNVFARLLESKGRKGDVLILMTTSGKSENIKQVLAKAQKMNIKIISLTGKTTSKIFAGTDIHIKIPSNETPRIQEAMMLIGHVICGGVEEELFG